MGITDISSRAMDLAKSIIDHLKHAQKPNPMEGWYFGDSA